MGMLIHSVSSSASTNTSIAQVIDLVLQDGGIDAQLHYPENTSFTPVPNQSDVNLPEYLGPITGPEFGYKITRISDSPSVSFEPLYPKSPSWNSNGSLLMASYKLLDGKTYEIIANNTWWDDDERKWSALHANIYYAMEHNFDLVNAHGDIVQLEENGDGKNDHIFVRRDVSSTLATGAIPAKSRLIYFSGAEYSTVLMGMFEGNIDHQDRYVVFAARKTGERFLTAIVYDIQHNTTTIKDLPLIQWAIDEGSANEEQGLDWISVSPSGQYILINWLKDPDNANGDYRASIDQYDIDLNFIRELSAQGQHGDIGVDAEGRDVYVQFEFYDRAAIWMYDLNTGVETKLLPSKYNGGHVSCRNYQRPGWCYLTTKHPDHLEVYAIKLDSSQTVNRFAQTHYLNGDAQGGVSPDGTKIIFRSDWNGLIGNGAFEAFVVEVPQ